LEESAVGEKFRLGEALVAEGLISEHQLRAALGEQARWGHRLGATLVEMGFLQEADLVRTLTRLLKLPGIDLDGKCIDAEVLALVPVSIAEKYRCLPLFCKREQGAQVLYLGMDEPANLAVVDEVSFRTGLAVRPVVVGPLQLQRALAVYDRGEVPTAPLRASSSRVEAPPADGETAPLVTPRDLAAGSIAGEAVFEAQAPAAATPPGAPTKQILQALVKLLIDKRVFSRRELLEAVQALDREASAGTADA